MGIIFANEQTIHKMRYLDVLAEHVFFEVPLNGEVDARVSDHTDLSVFITNAVYVAPCIYPSFQEHLSILIDTQPIHYGQLKSLAEKIVCGTQALNKAYPLDIAYNAVKLKNHFFHKLAYTEHEILRGVHCAKIETNQGYTRCSTMVLSEVAIITEDFGLSHIYKDHGYDVLLIEKGHVVLSGYNYGFFGGCGGVIENKLVLNGALKYHPNSKAIQKFVHQLGLSIIELHDDPLLDCGSILYLNT